MNFTCIVFLSIGNPPPSILLDPPLVWTMIFYLKIRLLWSFKNFKNSRSLHTSYLLTTVQSFGDVWARLDSGMRHFCQKLDFKEIGESMNFTLIKKIELIQCHWTSFTHKFKGSRPQALIIWSMSQPGSKGKGLHKHCHIHVWHCLLPNPLK